MDQLLRDLKHFCCVFIDNIVIFSDTFENHCRHLEEIFILFWEKSISINPEKSFISYLSIELLDFYVDNLGLYITKDRIQGFHDLEFPHTLKNLECYLDTTGFLYPLILYYTQLATPLQQYKTVLFEAERKEGHFTIREKQKRQDYNRTILISESI